MARGCISEIGERQTSVGVLVIGAGVSGMQAALLLAEDGHRVYVLDSAPGIRGLMHLLTGRSPPTPVLCA